MALPQLGSCAKSAPRGASHPFSMPGAARGFVEGGHQLEKLEFALAVAVTRGDASRVAVLREQIDALGGNLEEPGT